jgi:polyisoprenoid-binding protein YceI
MKLQVERLALTVFATLTLWTASPLAADENYRVAAAEVVIVCPLTIGGSFEARTKEVAGDLTPPASKAGPVGGALRINLQTLETGIAVRDRHMKSTYLQVERGADFATATLSGIEIDSLEGKASFQAMLALHGQSRPVTGTAEVHSHDGRYRVDAQFMVHISDYEIPAPTYLAIGVRDELKVKVKLTIAPGVQTH